MNKKNLKLSVLITATALSLSLFSGCAGKSEAEVSPKSAAPEITVNSDTAAPSPTTAITKAEIDSALAGYGDSAIDITWSPDSTSVAFIRLDGETSNVYVWKINEENAALISVAEPTTDGFSWSPNSKYFLINVGHMGPGTITITLIDAEVLEVVNSEISTVSVSTPVWSSDSRFLALSTWADYSSIEISVFAVASETTASLVKSNNTYGPYVVESWGADNIIKYTEMTNASDSVEKTIAIGE